MTLYFHVGLGKTGSTSIQTFLEINDQALRERGFVVPTTAGRRNHRRFAMYAADDHVISNLRRAKGYTTVEKIQKFRARFREEFLAEAATWPAGSTVLVTSEQTSQLRTPSALQRLKDLLDEAGQQTKIIIYFRRQDGMIVSEYSQFIKGGKTSTLQEEIDIAAGRRTYNYYTTALSWAKVFGKENIIVRPFERSQMVNGDVVADYLAAIGISDLSPYRQVEEQNRSLDIHVIEFLRHLNRHVPRWAQSGRNPGRTGLANVLEAISDGPKPRLSAAQAEAFMKHFETTNGQLAREFLGREDGRFFIDGFNSQSASSIQELTLDKAIELTALMWTKLKEMEGQQPDESTELD